MLAVSSTYKRRASLIALAVFVLHFGFAVLYLLPGSWLPYKAKQVVYHYTVPLFHQNWQLFAPVPPKSNDKLEYRVADEAGNWSAWRDAGAELLQQHRRYRVTWHGKLYNNYEDIGRRVNEAHYRFYNWYTANGRGVEEATEMANKRMIDTEAYRHAIAWCVWHHGAYGSNTRPVAIECRYRRSWVAMIRGGATHEAQILLPKTNWP